MLSRMTPADVRDLSLPEGPVLVCGGAGYIGSHTVRLFQEREVEVSVLDNLSTGRRAAVRAPLEVCDLGDRAALASAFERLKPAGIVHFAAKCYVGESVTDPSLYYRENVQNTWNLLEAMRAAGCRDIVFSSSCATYGNPIEIPITESHPQVPISPYGRTKLHMEHMLEDYSRAYGLRFAALRYFNAAGASRRGDLGEVHDPETHLIPLVLQVALGQRDEVLVFGDDYDTPDGTCIRDYIHVEDLADAHLRALAKLQRGTQSLFCNLGTGSGYSVFEVIETARRVTGQPIPARVVERRPGDPERLVSGGSRAFDELGWRPVRAELADIVSDAGTSTARTPRATRRPEPQRPRVPPARAQTMATRATGATWTVLGAGSILPRAGYGPSGYALRPAPGAPVTLFDCGPGSVRALAGVGIGLAEVERVVVSHFHPDHVLDLFALAFARRNPAFRPAPPLELVGPDGLAELVASGEQVFGRWVRDEARTLRTLPALEGRPSALATGGLELAACATGHTPEALAWRCTLPDGSRVAYTGDTGEVAAVAELARGVDLFVAECSFPDEQAQAGHLTPSSAARLARAAGCARLLLTHFYPSQDPEEARRAAARIFTGPIELARDGLELALGG